MEQARTEMVLEGGDDAAPPWLRCAGLTRDGGEASRFGDADEYLHRGNDVHESIR